MTNFPLFLVLAVFFGSIPFAFGQNEELPEKQKLFTEARARLMKEIDQLLAEVKTCSPPKFQSDIESKFGEAKTGLDIHETDVVAASKKALAALGSKDKCTGSLAEAKTELKEAKKLYDANIALAFESEGQLRTVLKLRTNVALKFVMSSTPEQQKACGLAEKVVDVMKEKNTALTGKFNELSASIDGLVCGAPVARTAARVSFQDESPDQAFQRALTPDSASAQ